MEKKIITVTDTQLDTLYRAYEYLVDLQDEEVEKNLVSLRTLAIILEIDPMDFMMDTQGYDLYDSTITPKTNSFWINRYF